MGALRSWLEGRWVEGSGTETPLHDPTNGDVVATVRPPGTDLGKALAYARERGGPALRSMTFAARAAMLEGLASAVHRARDELIELSRRSGGTTRGDAKFDIDGAIATMQAYVAVGRSLGERTVLLDGDAEGVLRSKRFVAQHLYTPRRGVAVHLNAFNFPAWGMAEKAAVAWLAGVPVLAKPATATSPLAARIGELWVATGLLPDGAFNLLVGPAGDLLDHLGPQDNVAFTGGSDTARLVRGHPAVVDHNVRVNIEADSLNVSIVGPDATPGTDTFQMFVNDAVRDLAQKAGQKCTAVRRILIPSAFADDAVAALVDRLSTLRVGDPAARDTDVGPVASAPQRASVHKGLAALDAAATRVWRADAPEGGCFVPPSLYRTDAGVGASFVNDHEVFGPVMTVLTYGGDGEEAVAIAARGGGGLVASVYTDDVAWAKPVLLGLAPWHGRIHWGSKKVHDQSPGPGTVLATLVHGGPGRAGGGEELGGFRGMAFYQQRTAVQADRSLLERVLDLPSSESPATGVR
jgi:oxepin-CoA hydrolase/3-oxo-5,6-dehydrosuberyl-CoA semialdehyde dehydrogenase